VHTGEPVLQVDGTTATVVAIRAVPGVASMWDLTVSNLHTFAVGVMASHREPMFQVPSTGQVAGARPWT
jgi:hypothetical protein